MKYLPDLPSAPAAAVALMAVVGLVLTPNVFAGEQLALKAEVQKAIGEGVGWLGRNQDPQAGNWGNPQQPALTALAVNAILGNPARQEDSDLPANVRRAYAFIRSQAKEDGGIYAKGLASYNTAVCLNSLRRDDSAEARELILKARRYLTNQGSEFEIRGESGDGHEGGSIPRPNLSKAQLILDSLHHSKAETTDSGSAAPGSPDLDWEAAIQFVDQTITRSAPKDEGEVIQDRRESNARPAPQADTKQALRSYSSMSYAGLLSLVYAPLDQDDSRIQAMMDWLQVNFSLEENPGLGAQGLYYYYHSMAKALTICRVDKLKMNDGREIDWRSDLAKKLLDLQGADGSWINKNGRWWEEDPVLVTSYALLTLQHVAAGL